VFSYGQTSSGKTFTMKGTNGSPGLIPLLLADIFKQVSNNEWGWYMKIVLSYMEIYNEQVNDLFNHKNTGLDIR
jgi:centromeric protein E